MRCRSCLAAVLFVSALAGVALAESQGGMEIQFVGLADGDTVAVSRDALGQVVPIPIRVRVTGPTCLGMGLVADGINVSSVDNGSGVAPFEVVVSWTPAYGAGTYVLEAGATAEDKSSYASARIVVTVTGIPALARPAPPQSREQAEARVIALYQERFGISLTAPALARKERSDVLTDPWVSTSWIGSSFYQIDLYPDGHDESYAMPVGPAGADSKDVTLPICRPEGVLTVLVVFLDYGNLNATPTEVLAALEESTRRLNEFYAAYPTASGSAEPILQMSTRGIVIAPPDGRDELLFPASEIATLTALDPTNYELVALVDLDAANTARHAYVTREDYDTFGLAGGCCPCTTPDVDIWVAIDERSQLFGDDSRLLTTLLAHEVYHFFGYPATHDWPCTNGSSVDASDCCASANVPALLLGWTDTDGDGIPELMDPTPYGMAVSP